MKLREWDWDSGSQGGYIEREYPDEPVIEFVNWLRNTRQWRESPEMVFQRFQKLERELAEIRNMPIAKSEGTPGQVVTVEARPTCSERTKAGAPCKGKAVQDGKCIAHVKARAA